MEDLDPVPLSALQHWAYCPRQCGLIHLEQAFDDNLHTLRGQAVHSAVDKPGVEVRAGLRVERALPLWNDALGLIGKADVVEFEPDGTPYPVEYKHGSRNKAAAIAVCDGAVRCATVVSPEPWLACANPRRTTPCSTPTPDSHQGGHECNCTARHCCSRCHRRAPLTRRAWIEASICASQPRLLARREVTQKNEPRRARWNAREVRGGDNTQEINAAQLNPRVPQRAT